ncbi:MAG: phosphotransferase [Candidatus Bathyarchaeota archaeon]|nr:MAG: phosphotransferase [Candidatus Bathyarchaeota archaeon]
MLLQRERLEEYLSALFGEKVDVTRVSEMGAEMKQDPIDLEEGDLKGFGYGVPYVITAKVCDVTRKLVLGTLRAAGGFGHDHFSDRAAILLWQHSAFSKMPKHVSSLDVGAFVGDGSLNSLGNCNEFFILTEYVEGKLYHEDLDRLKRFKQLERLDTERCRALSDYLVQIHKVKSRKSELYVRRIRELVGHSECIMGLLDSYPKNTGVAGEKELIRIEEQCVKWRWKLKKLTHRLAQVHGDYHPWNILFRSSVDFTVLDRSRGEWGEPADDISALTVNYLFYSLQAHGSLTGVFETLFQLFWKNYLDKTGDEEILSVVQPFLAWRGLVVASPIWYPDLSVEVRVKLLNFIQNILGTEKLDVKSVNSYLER